MFGVFSLPAPVIASFTQAPNTRIYGGEPVETCEWPTTVGLGGCTGTLIHPRVVLYAAHCGTRIPAVQFGEQYRSKIAHKVKTVHCKRNPAFKGQSSLGQGVDSAYCLLEKEVNDVPIAPVFYGCETDELKENGVIWLVGFGKNNNTEGLAKAGIKFKVETDFVRYKADGKELEVGSNGKTACNGDSGGPAFMKMSDGSWRTIGITSYGVDTSCTKVAYYSNASKALPWIQKSLGESGYSDLDLTPCFDDDGTWNPSEKCGGFAKDPGTAYGAWDNFCSEGAPTSGASSLCGDPNPKASGDETPPEVEITSPEHEDEFELDKIITVKVKASDEMDKEPDVVLLVDGEEQKTREQGPYKWKLEELSPGEHTLQAKAIDEAGNEASSKEISFDVVDPEEEGPSGADSENSGDGGKSAKGSDNSVESSSSSGKQDARDEKSSGCTTGNQSLGWSLFTLLGLSLRRTRKRLFLR